MTISSKYPRDLIGYGENSKQVVWPNQARIAIQFVINYEEGGENCLLHDDDHSESFLSDIIGASALHGQRNMNMESMYEYGSRAGFWRLYRLFKDFELPATVFGVATAMQRNPAAVDAMLNANWEIASHGYKWIDYQNIPLQEEQEHIAQAIEIHEKLTGAKPKGWYTGRVSENTRSLVLEHSDIIYDSDSYADDLPYWQPKELIPSERKPHLIVPYTLDANDMRFTTASGFSHAVPFYEYLRDTFDMLYTEGEHTPKMMSIGLHPRLIGRPGRLHGLKKFIEHIVNHDSVWVCRRQDIAEHWYREYPPKSE